MPTLEYGKVNAPAAPADIGTSGPKEGPSIREGGIRRLHWKYCDHDEYRRRHLNALEPAIVMGAIDHWPALNKWTPRFFRDHYGTRTVTIDGMAWRLDELMERILASSAERPAPYLRNELLAKWPAELGADISPMPDCTRPNYLESPLFPARVPPTYIELYIGGAGAKFPTLHYDALHTHAFLMQIFGVKEYLAFAPDQARFLYPRDGVEENKSAIPDVENPDLARFPLFRAAHGMRFLLHPGETLFIPSGWWHTARIRTTSITVSISTAGAGNWAGFRRDYCAAVACRSRLKSALLAPYMTGLGMLLSLHAQMKGIP
jgi:histone arginine demethylase JMJD6